MAEQEQQQSPQSTSIFGAEKGHCETGHSSNESLVIDSNTQVKTASPSRDPSFKRFKFLPPERKCWRQLIPLANQENNPLCLCPLFEIDADTFPPSSSAGLGAQ